MELSQRQDFEWQDQDVLNIACKGRWVELPQEWNWHFSLSPLADLHRKGDPEAAAIAHYAGEKPWNMNDSPYTPAWWKTALRCPYAGVFRQKLAAAPAVTLKQRLGIILLGVLELACKAAVPELALRARRKRLRLQGAITFRKLRREMSE